MADARCSCGALSLTLAAPAKLVVACHCIECQRRTGSPFGVGAFYPADTVTVSGDATEFVRDGTSGGKVRNHFCPDCGSTVYWTADRLPDLVGVAVGMLEDRDYPAPARSIYERTMHGWVSIEPAPEHFQHGTPAPSTR